MNLIELQRALRQLRLGGMADVAEARLRQAQTAHSTRPRFVPPFHRPDPGSFHLLRSVAVRSFFFVSGRPTVASGYASSARRPVATAPGISWG